MDPAKVATIHSVKPLDALSEPEWRELLLEFIKLNDSKELIPLLQKLPKPFKKWCLHSIVDGCNLLEYAILNSLWHSAHVIVHFESVDQLETPLSTNKANEILWARVIQTTVKRYLRTREIRSLHANNYQEELKERMKAYFIAYQNGCVSLFSAVTYPRAFILLHQLGANIRQKDNNQNTVVYLLISSKKVRVNIKWQLLRYVKRVAIDLLSEPSGSERILPSYDKVLIWLVLVRTKKGQTLAHFIRLEQLRKILTSEERLELFTYEDSLGTLMFRNDRIRWHSEFRYKEIARAFEIIVAQGRKPIPEFIPYLKEPYLRAFLCQLGVRHLALNSIAAYLYGNDNKCQVETAKKMLESRFVVGCKRFFGHFPIHELPTDMLTVLAAHWSVQDLIAVFSISKIMRNKYNSLDSPLLWKNIARNSFIRMKFSVLEVSGTNEWKKLVHSDSRISSNWKKNKYTTRRISDVCVLHLSLTDNWGCWQADDCFQFWNCHTDEISTLPRNTHYSTAAFIESSTSRDPIIAVCSTWGLDIFSSNKKLSSVLLPSNTVRGLPPAIIDRNHIVVGYNLALIDVQQEKVIKSLPDQISSYFTVNKFSTSPVIVSTNYEARTITFFDRDLLPVKNIAILPRLPSITSINAIDEHRLLLISYDGFRVMDIRSIPNTVTNLKDIGLSFPLRANSITYSFPRILTAVDSTNCRMLAQSTDLGLAMLWDINTFSWHNVIRHEETDLNEIVINNRYKATVSYSRGLNVYDYL